MTTTRWLNHGHPAPIAISARLKAGTNCRWKSSKPRSIKCCRCRTGLSRDRPFGLYVPGNTSRCCQRDDASHWRSLLTAGSVGLPHLAVELRVSGSMSGITYHVTVNTSSISGTAKGTRCVAPVASRSGRLLNHTWPSDQAWSVTKRKIPLSLAPDSADAVLEDAKQTSMFPM